MSSTYDKIHNLWDTIKLYKNTRILANSIWLCVDYFRRLINFEIITNVFILRFELNAYFALMKEPILSVFWNHSRWGAFLPFRKHIFHYGQKLNHSLLWFIKTGYYSFCSPFSVCGRVELVPEHHWAKHLRRRMNEFNHKETICS